MMTKTLIHKVLFLSHMINYKNIKEYEDLDFKDYLKLDGFSYSFLKSEKNGIAPLFNVTEKMALGSLVDAMITDPKTVDINNPMYDQAKEISACLLSGFGSYISLFKKQLSYTATIDNGVFQMQTKGRPDLTLKGYFNIDLKVSAEKDVFKIIKHFGYNAQQYHYAKLANVPDAYLLMYSKPLKKAKLIKCDFSEAEEFFNEKILIHGKLKTQ